MNESKSIPQTHTLMWKPKSLLCRYHGVKGKAHSFSQPHEPVQSTVQVNRKIDHLCMQCFCIFEEKYMCREGKRHKASSPCQSMALSTRWVYALSFSSAEKKSCNYWAFSQLFNVRLQRARSTKRLSSQRFVLLFLLLLLLKTFCQYFLSLWVLGSMKVSVYDGLAVG